MGALELARPALRMTPGRREHESRRVAVAA